jgi:hypothetical protein
MWAINSTRQESLANGSGSLAHGMLTLTWNTTAPSNSAVSASYNYGTPVYAMLAAEREAMGLRDEE